MLGESWNGTLSLLPHPLPASTSHLQGLGSGGVGTEQGAMDSQVNAAGNSNPRGVKGPSPGTALMQTLHGLWPVPLEGFATSLEFTALETSEQAVEMLRMGDPATHQNPPFLL